MSAKTNSVLIAEDQDIARLGLRLTLEKMAGIEIVGEAADGESAVRQALKLSPDLILMDIDLPGVSGIEATKQIKKAHPHTGIIMFTSDSSDESVFAALSAGADGYCLKNISAERLRTAINSVAEGAAWLDPGIAQRVLRGQKEAREQAANKEGYAGNGPPKVKALLDERQLQLLRLIEDGKSTEQIARQLDLPQPQVESQLRAILKSLEPAKVGTIIGDKFIIEDVIGSGGVSTVYKGKHLLMGRVVAIKMLLSQNLTDEGQIKRFLHEAQTASAISHPNVVTIFDFGLTSEGQPYIVMDYIDGVTLAKLIEEAELSLARVLGILLQVCDALAAAHKKGLIHRDLKPSNIMLMKTDDGTDLVKLVDFGLAKFVIESEDLKLTKTGEICGTPLYTSPEHFRGRQLDARSDIYSLGCVMYEALSGQPPFTGLTTFQLMNSHINEQPSRLPFLRPGKKIPEELESLLFQTLEKEPEKRPQTIAELQATISRIQMTCSLTTT